MKRFYLFLAAVMLVFSFSTSSSAASNDLIQVKSNTGKITIGAGEVFKPTKLEVSIYDADMYVGQSEYNTSVLVTAKDDNYLSEDVTDSAKIVSKNTKIVKVKNSFLLPVAKGTTTIEVSYKGLKTTKKITVKPAPTDSFTIKAPAGQKISSVNFYTKEQSTYDTKDYFYSSLILPQKKSASEYKFSGVNWNKTPNIYAVVSTGNRAYHLTITKAKNGKKITLSSKGFAEVTLKAPFKNLTYDTVALTGVDSKGKTQIAGYLNNLESKKIYVPKKAYNLQILARDKNNYYQFYKKGVRITKTKHTISISSKDVALQKIKINKKTKNSVLLHAFNGSEWTQFPYTYSQTFTKKGTATNVYLTKMEYKQLSINLFVNGNWIYYVTPPSSKVTKSSTINVSDAFRASIEFNKNKVYRAGEKIYLDSTMNQWSNGSFTIKDSYGNTLNSIIGKKGLVKGVFIFKNKNKTFKVPVNSLTYPSLKLPNTPGTYDVTFELAK
ncbi:hypothetical protein ACQKP0_04155 [Heyndrickxia sp. NPDC080065]|uniref:hypothetical protein n=1 Tax=Heyndrickxia sp. NPDC080065 TaxID=3390568 RepID=UPI003CFE7C7A